MRGAGRLSAGDSKLCTWGAQKKGVWMKRIRSYTKSAPTVQPNDSRGTRSRRCDRLLRPNDRSRPHVRRPRLREIHARVVGWLDVVGDVAVGGGNAAAAAPSRGPAA